MRIKKKDILEAVTPKKDNTTTADKEKGLEIAKNLGKEGADAKKEIINTLGDTPTSKEIADELVGAALKNEETEGVKPKRVKEVIKVKNLKK